MRLGIIGTSPGNGHPFSFSAIINGYEEKGFIQAGWSVILDYLRVREPADFGFPDVTVSHAWTQDEATTAALCQACRIKHAVREPEEMIGKVDAVIVARDDAPSHWPLAQPFLNAKLPVFIDKPLTLAQNELTTFWPYLCEGRVMSCSGLRFAIELDAITSKLSTIGKLQLVRGTTLNDWEKYGVHLLDAALRTTSLVPVSVRRLPATHDSLLIGCHEGTPIQIDALGDISKLFLLEIIGEYGRLSADLLDNFSAFKNTIHAFIKMVRTGRPSIPAIDTWRSISTIIAGHETTTVGTATMVPPPPPDSLAPQHSRCGSI